MQCLLKYKWVKLPRDRIPESDGILGSYLRLTARAAICPGRVRYCQYENAVTAGMWAGGIVGLKSILRIKKADQALLTLKVLAELGLITYEYKPANKYIWYKITDYIAAEGMTVENENSVYVYDAGSFIRIPRSLTDVLIKHGCVFSEADAWVDLWCHTVCGDTANVFTCMCPCVQYQRQEAALTLDLLAKRWGWHKLKVQRFLAKNRAVFCLKKLPGSYGCIIFNLAYNGNDPSQEPTEEQVFSVCRYIKKKNRNDRRRMTDHCQFCRLVLKYTKKCLSFFIEKKRVSFPYKRGYCSSGDILEDIDCGKVLLPDKSYIPKKNRIDIESASLSPFINPFDLFDDPMDVYRYLFRRAAFFYKKQIQT